jgi:hypothetical protein
VIAIFLSPRAGGGFDLPAFRRQETTNEISQDRRRPGGTDHRSRRARRDHPDDRGLFRNRGADADGVEPNRMFGVEEVLLMIA